MNTDQNYRDLANAIVLRAAKDYQVATKRNLRNEVRILERFFRSEWFNTLSGLDGEQLMKDIRGIANNERGIRMQTVERSQHSSAI